MHQDDDELAFWLAGEQYIFEFDQDEEPTQPSIKKPKGNGCVCVKCGELYPFAEPNQFDGTFKCWGCRH